MLGISYIGDPQLFQLSNPRLRKRIKRSIYQLGLSGVTVLSFHSINTAKLILILLHWNSVADNLYITQKTSRIRNGQSVIKIFERVGLKNIYNMCSMYKPYMKQINIFMEQFKEEEIDWLLGTLNVFLEIQNITQERTDSLRKIDDSKRRQDAYCKIIMYRSQRDGDEKYLLCIGYEKPVKKPYKERVDEVYGNDNYQSRDSQQSEHRFNSDEQRPLSRYLSRSDKNERKSSVREKQSRNNRRSQEYQQNNYQPRNQNNLQFQRVCLVIVILIVATLGYSICSNKQNNNQTFQNQHSMNSGHERIYQNNAQTIKGSSSRHGNKPSKNKLSNNKPSSKQSNSHQNSDFYYSGDTYS